MRIIAGDYKGRKIFEPLDKETRPLKDLTKESIFNILEHSKNAKIPIKKSNVLDVFSGTGSFGLECISRGASKVYFIEQHKPSIKILIKNIEKLNCEKSHQFLQWRAVLDFSETVRMTGEWYQAFYNEKQTSIIETTSKQIQEYTEKATQSNLAWTQ